MFLIVATLIALLFEAPAQAACPNSIVSTGLKLTLGVTQNLFLHSPSTCALVAPASGGNIVFSPSSLASFSAGSQGFVITPGVAGTGTLTASAPGLASTVINVTVVAGTIDVSTAP
jgi:hypothetical protein